ncbi:hypothetical protein D3C78_1725510 [compost metagenome]
MFIVFFVDSIFCWISFSFFISSRSSKFSVLSLASSFDASRLSPRFARIHPIAGNIFIVFAMLSATIPGSSSDVFQNLTRRPEDAFSLNLFSNSLDFSFCSDFSNGISFGAQ